MTLEAFLGTMGVVAFVFLVLCLLVKVGRDATKGYVPPHQPAPPDSDEVEAQRLAEQISPEAAAYLRKLEKEAMQKQAKEEAERLLVEHDPYLLLRAMRLKEEGK